MCTMNLFLLFRLLCFSALLRIKGLLGAASLFLFSSSEFSQCAVLHLYHSQIEKLVLEFMLIEL